MYIFGTKYIYISVEQTYIDSVYNNRIEEDNDLCNIPRAIECLLIHI